MKNITLIASKRITYIISVNIGFAINYSPNTRFDNAQCFYSQNDYWLEVLRQRWHCLTGNQVYTTNYTEFLLPPSKGSHPTNSSTGILVLSEIGFIIADNLTTPSTPSHRTSRTLRMLLAQILTYRTPTRCNAPSQWGTDFVAWKAQAQPTTTAFYRPKPIEADFLMHLMHLTSNRQRSFSNKIN